LNAYLAKDGKPIAEYFDPRPDNAKIGVRAGQSPKTWGRLRLFRFGALTPPAPPATDLTDVKWNGGATEIADLDRVISGDHIRARLVIQSVQKYCSDLKSLRALAFCVSVRHAELMAGQFKAAKLEAVAVTGGTDCATPQQMALVNTLCWFVAAAGGRC
jgi:hypothetical protein